MFRIKICGVTSAADARAAAAAGADAIGLNFFAGSRRYLPPEAAKEVADAIPRGVLKVGVFVNAPAEFVCRESDRLNLDLIQLAGDETPEYVGELGGRPVMKAFRPQLDGNGVFDGDFFDVVFFDVTGFLQVTEKLGCVPKLVLIDAYQPGEFGGTGKTIDWPQLAHLWNEFFRPSLPLVLAGGLNPENVQSAVEIVRPAAVDVASGVESLPGVKDAERMVRFVAAARAGFKIDSPQQPPASRLQPPASPHP